MPNDEYKYAIVDLSNNITTISTKPALVKGVYVNTVLSAHTVNIEDGIAAVIILEASISAGTVREWPSTQFKTSLIVNPDDASTGNITVFYSDLRA